MTGTTHYAWLYVLLTLSTSTLGIALLIFGLRGKRLDYHPVCRKCKYDLSGLPDSATCPECGTNLKTPRSTLVGNRRKRPVLIATGLLLILLATFVAGSLLLKNDHNHYKPMWWLRIEARNTSGSSAKAAIEEISQRDWSDNPKLAQTLYEDALKVQADTSRPWMKQWGNIAYDAIGSGAGTEAEHEQFTRAYLSIQLFARPKIRLGKPIPIQIQSNRGERNPGDFRVFDLDHGPYNVYLVKEGERIKEIATISTAINDQTISDTIFMDLPPAMDVEPGIYEIQVTGGIRIFHQYRFTSPDTPLCTWDIATSTTIELLPADGPPAVVPVDDPAMASLLTRAPASVSIEWTEDERQLEIVLIRVDVPKSCKCGLVFDVSFSDGNKTWEADYPATLYPGPFTGHTLTTACILPDDFKASEVDIILKPNLEAAEATLGVLNILNHTIIINDVPVENEFLKPVNSTPPDVTDNHFP